MSEVESQKKLEEIISLLKWEEEKLKKYHQAEKVELLQ